MDTQAGAQSAANSHQTTIDLQAGVIASQKNEIDRLNVLAVDNAAEIASIKQTVKWYQGEAGKRMGAVARAEMAGAPVQRTGESLFDDRMVYAAMSVEGHTRTSSENVRDVLEAVTRVVHSAAPAAPSEQAEPSERKVIPIVPTDAMLKAGVRAFQHGYRENDSLADWRAFYVAALAAAPAAPLPDQPEQIQPQQSGSIRPSAEPAGQQDASFSDSILHAIYKACQRGDSPERMHAAVMALAGKSEQSAFLRAAMDFAQAHINCDEIESAYESNPESGSEADTAEVDAMYNITKKRLVESYRALNSAAPLAGAAPLPELTGPSAPTDLSKRLRDMAEEGIWAMELNAAADEIERYYGGMMAWKQTAEAKDVESAEHQRVVLAACSDLGLINEALGLDPDDGGADPILDAIERLKAAASPSPAPAPTEPQQTLPLCNSALRAEPAGQQDAGDEWLPIETAPKGASGYSFMQLAWGPEGDQSTGDGIRWGDRFFAAAVFHCLGADRRFELREIEVTPTHWMPSPAASAEQSSSPASRMGGITSKESAETAAPGASIGDDPEFDKLAEAWRDLLIKASSPTSFDMYDKKLAEARAAFVAFLDKRSAQ